MKQSLRENLARQCHESWIPYLVPALDAMDQDYLDSIEKTDDWLPGWDRFLSAFSIPLTSTRYILLGESPYPRAASANGYAFWDAAVGSLWAEKGLSKAVNRATSLRHFMKMLLHARGDLTDNFSQDAIAALDKSTYIQTASELFTACMDRGILLLNASLVFRPKAVPFHARHWQPFLVTLFGRLAVDFPEMQWLLFGRIAQQTLGDLFEIQPPNGSSTAHDGKPVLKALLAEHPYNITFITNPDVISFFKPLELLHAN